MKTKQKDVQCLHKCKIINKRCVKINKNNFIILYYHDFLKIQFILK